MYYGTEFFSLCFLTETILYCRKNENFLDHFPVEKEIERLNDETDRQLRLLKHEADIVRLEKCFLEKTNQYF